jgi:hypothetical protein
MAMTAAATTATAQRWRWRQQRPLMAVALDDGGFGGGYGCGGGDSNSDSYDGGCDGGVENNNQLATGVFKAPAVDTSTTAGGEQQRKRGQ